MYASVAFPYLLRSLFSLSIPLNLSVPHNFPLPHFSSTPGSLSTPSQVGFYRSFGRPIAKVFLGAVCTYQVVYILWTQLEIDEVKREKKGT